MFDFRLNLAKNAIICLLKGRFDEQEAHAYVEKYKRGIDQLQPGFTVIADVQQLVPPVGEVGDILQEGTAYAVSKGMSRAVRVVDENTLSQVSNEQLERVARDLGYQAEIVGTMAEALRACGLDRH